MPKIRVWSLLVWWVFHTMSQRTINACRLDSCPLISSTGFLLVWCALVSAYVAIGFPSVWGVTSAASCHQAIRGLFPAFLHLYRWILRAKWKASLSIGTSDIPVNLRPPGRVHWAGWRMPGPCRMVCLQCPAGLLVLNLDSHCAHLLFLSPCQRLLLTPHCSSHSCVIVRAVQWAPL